jgi:tRNA (guanosine-2'-O-)-methyltransferase
MTKKNIKLSDNSRSLDFPLTENFYLDGENFHYTEVLERLCPMLTEQRVEKMKEVVSNRTYQVQTVMENLYDEGNIGAVIRSSESFGFQAMHIIHAKKTKVTRTVTRGSDKWLDFFHWDESKDCFEKLKSEGFQILATTLAPDSVSLYDIDFSKKTAIVMGNEKDGVSQTALQYADHKVMIPMVGFSQSFNISVASAICLSTATQHRTNKGILPELSPTQQDILRASYMTKTMANPHKLIREMRERC